MKLTAALEYEKKREHQEDWNKIILHKDGNFYHAYDWSAWLIKTVVCTEELQRARGDKSYLTPLHYVTKNNDYVIAGFPVESLSKYVPDYEEVRAMDGDDLEITVKLELEPDTTFDELQKAFESFKSELPVKEPNKGAGKNALKGVSQAAILNRSGLFQILAQVIAYPVESSTPAQNIEFISHLKQQVAQLL